jgi:periplasmic copper chaperone A
MGKRFSKSASQWNGFWLVASHFIISNPRISMSSFYLVLPRALRALLLGSLVAIANFANAHDFTVGNLFILHPYAVPSAFAAKNGAAYVRGITNRGTTPDKLVSASTPAAASVELHTMRMDGDIMRMREIVALPLPASAEVTLRHDERGENGYHLMLMGIKKPLNEGDRFPLTLTFEKAGSVEVVMVVQKAKSDAANNHKH